MASASSQCSERGCTLSSLIAVTGGCRLSLHSICVKACAARGGPGCGARALLTLRGAERLSGRCRRGGDEAPGSRVAAASPRRATHGGPSGGGRKVGTAGPLGEGEKKGRRDPETGVTDPSRTPGRKGRTVRQTCRWPTYKFTDNGPPRRAPAHDRLSAPSPPAILCAEWGAAAGIPLCVFLFDLSHPLPGFGTTAPPLSGGGLA